MPIRDDFPQAVVRALKDRVGSRCSSPQCLRPTSGPNETETKVTIIGVASHITAAAPGGPRFDPALTPEQRSDISNGIWLCQNCGRLVDADPALYPTEVLRSWKTLAEHRARHLLQGGSTSLATPTTEPSRDPQLQYERAECLLRPCDVPGWRRFERNTHSDLVKSLHEWKNVNAPKVQEWADWMGVFPSVDSVIGPAVVASLSAIESSEPQVVDQRGLIDELVGIRDWSPGVTPVDFLPEALAMFAHHAMGALMVNIKSSDKAINLLAAKCAISVRYHRDPESIYRIDTLMGWNDSFARGDCNLSWTWLVDCWNRMPWLRHFFGNQRMWEESLSAYQFLASMVDFAMMVANSNDLKSSRANTPLSFWNGDHSSFVRNLSKALPNGDSVRHLAQVAGVDRAALSNAFGDWANVMLQTRAGYGGGIRIWISRIGENVPRLP